MPTVEVRCENLTMEAKVSVGSRALPTVLNSYRNFFEVSWSPAVYVSLASTNIGRKCLFSPQHALFSVNEIGCNSSAGAAIIWHNALW